MKTVGEKIKELRIQSGLTQKQLAEILETDQSNYSKYEIGKLEFNHEMLRKLSKQFYVSIDYLLGIEDY